MRGATTVVKTVRICWYVTPHVDLAILDIASANLVPFFAVERICSLKRNFLSKMTPSYRTSRDGWMTVFVIQIGVSIAFLRLEKWIRTYLEVSNLAPWVALHLSALTS